jgi:hypothetical protein
MSLKTILGAAGCVLFLGTGVAAQLPTMSIAVGQTYAWRDTNQTPFETESLGNLGGGGSFRFGSGVFSFEPGVLVTTKGTSTTSGGEETRLKLDYIELPILGMITIGPSNKVRPFVGAGPVIGLEMRCRIEVLAENTKEEVGCDLPNSATFDRHKVDLSVAGLAGVDYALPSSRRLGLQARYTHGLRNISDSEDPDLEIRNRALSVFLTFSFPLNPDF